MKRVTVKRIRLGGLAFWYLLAVVGCGTGGGGDGESGTNQAPELAAIGAQSAAEGTQLSFAVSASDPDGASPTVTASGLPTGAMFAGGTFTWTPDYTQAGSHDVTFTADDGALTDTEVVTITVSNTNRAPVLAAIGAQSAAEGTQMSFAVSASDSDGTTPTVTASGLPTGATFAGGIFTWTPDYTQEGSYNATFTATDGALTDSEVVTITVSHTNRAPELAAIGALSAAEGMQLSFAVSASDFDGTTPTVTANGLPMGATFTGGTFTWTPDYTQAGSHDVTFTATDGALTDSEVVTITVSNTNRAPELAAIGAQSAAEGTELSFGVSASDPDGTTPTVTASGLPSGATFAGGTFTWTPDYTQAGSYDVTFTADDGALTDSEGVTISVTAVDTTPPMVLITGPAADASNVAPTTTVTVTFSEDMDSTIMIPTNFTLMGTSGPVAGSVGYAGGVATFTPTARLAYSTTYTATLSGAVTDLAGNPLEADHSWTFTTAAEGGADYTDPVTGMQFVYIPAGSFTMGDEFGDGASWELPTHRVTLTQGFYLGKYEVTQDQWQAVMGANPSYFSSCGGDCPVEQVSWNDIQTFVTELNTHSGQTYRLPTEAEWEYAAKGGANGEGTKYAGSDTADTVAWHSSNSGSTTHPVGTKAPNGLGLYDMSGNVWEWVQDWYGAIYYASSPANDPTGPRTGLDRIIRGGGWSGGAGAVRAGYRAGSDPDFHYNGFGFRLLRVFAQDVVSPTLQAVWPTEGATGVGTGTMVSATFSEPMDPATLDEITFTLVEDATGSPVEGTVSYAGSKVTFTPTIVLAYSAPHTATLSGTATDLAGNALGADHSWSFTTTAADYTDPITGMEFVYVPAGTFTMGDEFGYGNSDEQPTHTVTLTQDFYLGKYEVTQAQWQTVMGTNPSRFSACGGACPVERVSWDDIQTFLTTLNAQSGQPYRLPTEAEWEYAAKGGPNGDGTEYAGSDTVDTVAWYSGNSGWTTHPAGIKMPNGLGLCDMSGNVWEWVQDWYGSYSAGSATDPTGPAADSTRVIRGGSWYVSIGDEERVSARSNRTPSTRNDDFGFRLLRVTSQDVVPPTLHAVSPTDAATGVGTGTMLSATFSEPMDPTTLDEITFTLEDAAGSPVEGMVSYEGRTATFTPTTVLTYSVTYTAVLSGAVTDVAGNPLGADYAWSFITTAAAGDIYTDPTTGMQFVSVPPGSFTMGDEFGDGNSNEQPTHTVTLTRGFYLGKYEVTQDQWQAVMGANPSLFSSCGGDCPVERVLWDDIQTFLTTLNTQTGQTYRLPTEAEWEYAAKGGPNGGDGTKYAGSNTVGDVAWYSDNNTPYGTKPVGTKAPNGLGLYDMSGNVSEFVQDWYGFYSAAAATDPTEPAEVSYGAYRVIRGGDWYADAVDARVAYRSLTLHYPLFNRGFRLVLSQ